MATYTMPSNRGARCSAVPAKRPKYAPQGYHRCDECNSLVRDGAEHSCHVEQGSVIREVRTSRVEPIQTDPALKKPTNWKFIYSHTTEPDEFTRVCSVCGGKFKDSMMGRISKMCPKCR